MSLLESFKGIVGEVNVSEGQIDRLVYSSDASRQKGSAELIVWPVNVEQIHKIIMMARRGNTAIMPRGAGTSMGNAVPSDDIVLDVSKMNHILNVGEGFVEAEAGAALQDINKAIGSRFFPVQPESKKACTIGGMIASNAIGVKALEFGRMENWVEEVTMVDGNGMCLKLKGEALKHVVGMQGSTGIIVSARLKLLKMEDEKSISLLGFNTLTAMQEKLEELNKDTSARNIEFLDDICSEILGFAPKIHLIVEYEGSKGNLKEAEAREVWSAREQLPFLLGQRKHLAADDLLLPFESIPKFLHVLRKDNVPCYGPIGMGILYPVFREDNSMAERFRALYRQFGAKQGVKYGHGKRKHTMDDENSKRFLELKAHYDPKNLFSRGKLI
ncbi:MAG: FAD-binding oxidoreductase [Candidatus Nanoarchaeia archaeon]|nr:FAD-binding oxidoreductase [Candidatus Nanoarchaeia archaeon]